MASAILGGSISGLTVGYFRIMSKVFRLVVLGQYREQNATSHGDIDGMVEAVKLILGIGCDVKVAPLIKQLNLQERLQKFVLRVQTRVKEQKHT